MFSKFSMFEHKESMNITEARKEKGWAQQVKHKKCESISLFFIIFFVSLEMTEISVCFNLLPPRNIEAVAQMCSVKKAFLQIWQNSQEKHLCQSLLFNKVADMLLIV